MVGELEGPGVLRAWRRAYGPDAVYAELRRWLPHCEPAFSGADKHVVVLVAGRALATQTRGVGAQASNYLEASNGSGGTRFQRAPPTASFNDVVVFE